MVKMIPIVSTLGFLLITILGSRFFYYFALEKAVKKNLEHLNYKIEDLEFSFEEITYFVTIPTNNKLIKKARRQDLYIEKEFLSPIYPSIVGLKIILKNKTGKDKLIAYLARDNFRLPLLDKLMFHGQLNQENYTKIVSYKLIHPETMRQVKNEVYSQLKKQRYT